MEGWRQSHLIKNGVLVLVVSVRGEGENTELDIAFPSPTGIKRLLSEICTNRKSLMHIIGGKQNG